MAVGVTMALVGACTLVFVVLRKGEDIATGAAEEVNPPRVGAVCGAGLERLGAFGCFAAPASVVNPPLLVYLHGRYDLAHDQDERERQSTIARMAVSRGIAVLALRGDAGECDGDRTSYDVCWPSGVDESGDATSVIARMGPAIREARARVGAPAAYLLGYADGGYFASLIATRALLPFDGYAIAYAGLSEATLTTFVRPPILLITSDSSPKDPETGLADEELARASWPHVVVAREGAMGLRDWDIDVALTFFQRIRTEELPLWPALGRGRLVAARDLAVSSTQSTSAEMPVNPVSPLTPPRADPVPSPVVVAPQTASGAAPPPAVTILVVEPTPPPTTIIVHDEPPSAPPPVVPPVYEPPPTGVPTDEVPSRPYYP